MEREFYRLISMLDTCLDETEGGTDCAFYTLVIRMDSLYRIFVQKPESVAELLGRHRFLRAEDWTISTCGMSYEFDDTITFMEQIDLKGLRDFFIVYGTVLDYSVTEEEFIQRFSEFFPKTSRYFDLVKVLRGNMVIRLKTYGKMIL